MWVNYGSFEYQSLTVIWAHYEITITASHGLAHHHIVLYIIRISDAGLLSIDVHS